MSLARALVLAAFTLGVLAAPAAAQPNTYPSRPLQLVVPFPSGGINDLAARLVAPRLAEALGQPVVVDNRAGAAGRIGAEAVARARADGYTLLLGMSMTHGMAAASAAKDNYDPVRSFVPIAPLYWYGAVLICHPSVPARNLAELIAFAKVQPGGLTYSSAGIGSGVHFFFEQFAALAGFRTLHVPFRGGAPALQAVLGGQVQCSFDGAAKAHIDSGALRAYATTGLQRDVLYPTLPTLHEAGLTGFDMKIWQGLFVPASTPAEVVRRLRNAWQQANASPALTARAAALGLNALPGGPEELARLVAAEVEKYQALSQRLGIQFE